MTSKMLLGYPGLMPILQAELVEPGEHRTAYLRSGPADGPLLIFVHGWPELGLLWRHQTEHFARQGWRGVAPAMRGYGGVPPAGRPRSGPLPPPPPGRHATARGRARGP